MTKHVWRMVDHTTVREPFSALDSFAYDDTLCSIVHKLDTTFIRTWVHDRTVVLGIQDGRLPHIEAGLDYLAAEKYKPIIRNSGGLAVLLDEGVLNISLIMKDTKRLSIDGAYEKMYELIQRMFSQFHAKIEAYEIVGSYCPGSFDLSIGGKKFAGISQRRIRGGISVQIYLCVNGSGSKRAETIGHFYHQAIQGKETKFVYPAIIPETMASLSELLHVELTIEDVVALLLTALKQKEVTIAPYTLSAEDERLFQKNYDRMMIRNEKIASQILE